jgi:hypothetical protein
MFGSFPLSYPDTLPETGGASTRGSFTHAVEMDWMLPGSPPTGGNVEIRVAVVVQFRDGKIASEHIYWDQA